MKKIFKILLLFIGCPFWVVAQGNIPSYPKDTIYINYKPLPDSNWNAKFERNYNEEPGIFFNIEKKQNDMTLFYPYSKKSDTLCSAALEDFHFSDIEEIENREKQWVDQKYKNLKVKPYNGSKNPVFQTYVIERISECEIVKYPVIWRNEGVRP